MKKINTMVRHVFFPPECICNQVVVKHFFKGIVIIVILSFFLKFFFFNQFYLLHFILISAIFIYIYDILQMFYCFSFFVIMNILKATCVLISIDHNIDLKNIGYGIEGENYAYH